MGQKSQMQLKNYDDVNRLKVKKMLADKSIVISKESNSPKITQNVMNSSKKVQFKGLEQTYLLVSKS